MDTAIVRRRAQKNLPALLIIALCTIALVVLFQLQGLSGPAIEPNWLNRQYGNLPLVFETNVGQSNEEVEYLSRGNGFALLLTAEEAAMAVWQPAPAGDTATIADGTDSDLIRIQFLGANPEPEISGETELPGRVNYLLGDDPAGWHTDISTYEQVRYQALYPGIDLIFYGNGHHVEYDFVVSPGADPAQIRLAFAGVHDRHLDENGDLILSTDAGDVRQRAPHVYQLRGGEKTVVQAEYQLADNGEVRFTLGEYDRSRTLIIDPVVYSTFLGGTLYDAGHDIAVDSAGAAYVTGWVTSPDFPSVPGGYTVPNPNGFLVKVNPAGTALEYTAFVEGISYAVDLDDAGNAYIGGDIYQGYAAKISADGSSLLYQVENLGKQVNGVAVDPAGNLYVTGDTELLEFTPTPGAFQTTYGGWYSDAFVAKFDSSGAMVYGSYLGGDYDDFGEDIVVDDAGHAYVTGSTWSYTFPTVNAFQNNKAGSYDAILTKVSPDGSSLVYSTYFGGTERDHAYGIDLDGSDQPHITGYTHSWDSFPLQNPYQSTSYASDAFISKFNDSASGLVFSTFLGGGTINGSVDEGRAIAVDGADNVIITGRSETTNYPVTANAPQGYYAGDFYDIIVSKLSPDGQNLLFSTYLGGALTEQAWGVAVDNGGAIYVTGDTSSFEYPTVNPLQRTIGISGQQRVDAFVTKFDESAPAGPLVDLTLSMEDSSNIVQGNEPVTYTITIENNGPDTATNLEYVGRYPFIDVVSISPGQGTCTPIFAVYHSVCALGDLPAGGSTNIIAVVLAPDVNGGSMSIDGFTYSDQLDTNNLDNSDMEVTLISDEIYGLTVQVNGNGTVRSTNILGINCPPDCFENYVGGQGVMLVAEPGPGAQFEGWSGACSGSGGCTVTMNQDQSVTATFSDGFTPTPTSTAPPPTSTAPPPTATAPPPTATATAPPPTETPPPGANFPIYLPLVIR